MLIEEDRHAHILQHASGITVTIVITDLKLNGEPAGHRLHVGIEEGPMKATPIIAVLPLLSDEALNTIVAEVIEEVTNIDMDELLDQSGEASEGP